MVGGSETILVVEDDLPVQATVIELLTGLGYSVLRANDAQSALSILQSGIGIDLLFTDVVMPGPLSSTELARQARLLQPEVAVLFTSGYTRNAVVHGGRLDPGVELLSKPYRQEDLARRCVSCWVPSMGTTRRAAAVGDGRGGSAAAADADLRDGRGWVTAYAAIRTRKRRQRRCTSSVSTSCCWTSTRPVARARNSLPRR